MPRLSLPSVRDRFLEILAEAKSNRTSLGSGADIYLSEVEPLRVTQSKEGSFVT
jgi:hypothetical protein